MSYLLLVAIGSAVLVIHPPQAQGTGGQQPPSSAAQAPPEALWPPEGVFRPGNGVTMPRVIKEVKPSYTADAMRTKISGSVLLEALVQTDGRVGEVRVKRSLDQRYGLDDAAVAAVKQWQFATGTKDDVAVPVVVEVEMAFAFGRRRK